MDTDTHDALMAAILAHPEQDLPRLVYADFLEENCQSERAEFIRLQCAGEDLQRQFCLLVGSDDPPNWTKWCYAEDRLDDGMPCRKGRRGGLNCYPSPPSLGGEYVNVVRVPSESGLVDQKFTRGFVGEVRCPLDWWCGQTCGVCGGTGHSFGELWGSQNACAYCGGNGGTVANGPTVVKSHPVAKVTATDVGLGPQHYYRPTYDPPIDVWGWLPNGADGRPTLATNVVGQGHYVPHGVHARLTGGEVRGEWRDYPTRQAATDALSDALLSWAKEESSE